MKKSAIDLERITERIHDLRLSCSKEKWLSLSQDDGLHRLLAAYDVFCEDDNSPKFAFWSSYIQMVELLLSCIR